MELVPALKGKPMKIAFDHSIFFQKYGGISRYFTMLADQFNNSDLEVGIFAPLYCNEHLKQLPSHCVRGSFLKQYPPKTTKIIQYLNHVLSKNAINRFEPSILHKTYYSSLKIKNQKCPTILTVFDLIHEIFSPDDPKLKRFLSDKKYSIETADHIICISENTKSDLKKFYGVRDDKISVTYLGVEEIHGNSNLDHDTPKINKKPFLLYLGERAGYKNFFGFMKGFSLSHHLMKEFEVIAFGGGQFTKNELKFFQNLGFKEDQVHQVTGPDVVLAKYFQTASAFVYPSLYEGFGLPPLEAMAYGCPVVASHSSSIPEVVGDAGIYFDGKNPENICEVIERAVYCSEVANKLRQEGFKRVKLFTWDICATNTINAYRKIL